MKKLGLEPPSQSVVLSLADVNCKKRVTALSKVMKCHCGFVRETESELKSYVLKVQGARDGDWKGWMNG